MIDSLVYTVRDTLAYVDRAEVLQLYKDLAESQSAHFTIIVTVISVVFAVVVGATWWWNYMGAKSQIHEEVTSSVSQLDRKFSDLQDILHKSITEKVSLEFSEGIGDFSAKIDEMLQKYENRLNDIQSDVDDKVTAQQAELSRLFALHCDSTKSYYNAFTWWFKAFTLYHKIDHGEFCQIAAKAALESLEKMEKKDAKKEPLTEYVKLIEQEIPDILKSERDSMIKRISFLVDENKPEK